MDQYIAQIIGWVGGIVVAMGIALALMKLDIYPYALSPFFLTALGTLCGIAGQIIGFQIWWRATE